MKHKPQMMKMRWLSAAVMLSLCTSSAWAFSIDDVAKEAKTLAGKGYEALMNPLMILVKIIKLRWIHILSYDQMVSRKINNQTTRCANSIFYTTLFTNSAPNYT